ncbi:MAG: bifunctional DNA-formamidopyrimidine glycosylase/DNA-(apurinic or apyrimidinic site) lyase [Gammaproteobacteria bacterium]|jgi:formamidopyrimidine-DNA glycosylase|nr:bifunctional DNA-formamidopyrimidine glycosylase/DNA-(apurinic or apyrimidinic site) lyase [Gammaproteobacteria bacterium]
MPELPEVETTRRGIAPHVEGRHVAFVHVRQRQLRLPVTDGLERILPGQRVDSVERRGKYLILRCTDGALILHLGMSGSLRVTDGEGPGPGAHDHVDIGFDDGAILRLRDPRRFGLLVWTAEEPHTHSLLRHLGPEPLAGEFGGAWLHARSRGRRTAVKTFIMDSRIVVGVGNIYASEVLHRCGIHPLRAAGRISAARYEALAAAIRDVLQAAIRSGGTTLRDFRGGDGQPGYFSTSLEVYGREGESCRSCGGVIRCVRQAQRSTYFCPACQR